MNFDEIKRIVQLMQENDLAEFEMEREGFRIVMRKSQPNVVTSQVVPVATPSIDTSSPHTVPIAETAAAGEEAEQDNYQTIISPMVGTFYAAPSPDSDPYVEVGDEVDEETVVCILEAMKVMNEIKAEVCGRIVEILVENAEPVEYGQPLYKVEPVS